MREYFDEKDSDFYKEVYKWVNRNKNHEYYVIYGVQQTKEFEDFCRAVLSLNKTPVIITNVGAKNRKYSLFIRNAMSLSPKVRVYESAKMAMSSTLISKANLFTNTRGGIVWTR